MGGQAGLGFRVILCFELCVSGFVFRVTDCVCGVAVPLSGG